MTGLLIAGLVVLFGTLAAWCFRATVQRAYVEGWYEGVALDPGIEDSADEP